MGRLTNKQREIKTQMETLLFMIVRESGAHFFFEAEGMREEIIGNIAKGMINDFKKENPDDVMRAFSSLTYAKR